MTDRKQNRALTTIAAGLLVLLLLACALLVAGSFFISSSAKGTLQSGRKVSIETDSFFLSSTFSKDVARIRSGSMRILVQPDSLIVDGVTVASIDPAASDVSVSIDNGEVTFVVDGETIPFSP